MQDLWKKDDARHLSGRFPAIGGPGNVRFRGDGAFAERYRDPSWFDQGYSNPPGVRWLKSALALSGTLAPGKQGIWPESGEGN